jgi:hypothetical protein
MAFASVSAVLLLAPMVMSLAPSLMLPLSVPDSASVPSVVEFAASEVGTLPNVRLVTTAGVVTAMFPLLEMAGLLPVSVLVAANDRAVPVELSVAVIP